MKLPSYTTAPKSALAQLQRARRIINAGWCQSAYARTADGKPCYSEFDEDAVSCCAVGAMYRAGSQNYSTEIVDEARQALDDAANVNVFRFNDNEDTTKQDVLAVFDKAIESLST